MAKKVLPDHYTFDPATRTITIPNRVINREQLLLVTNVSSNTVIFNFSDPDLKTTTYTAPYSSTGTQLISPNKWTSAKHCRMPQINSE